MIDGSPLVERPSAGSDSPRCRGRRRRTRPATRDDGPDDVARRECVVTSQSPSLSRVPQEVADAALDPDAGEHVRCVRVVDECADAIVSEHRSPELVQTQAAGDPPRRDDHRQEARLELLRLLHERAGRSGVARAVAAIRAELVRRVADDDVELHVVSEQLGDASLDVVGVDEGVGVGLEALAAVEGLLAGAAVLALAVGELLDLVAVLIGGVDPLGAADPGVLDRSNQMLPSSVVERLGDGVLAVGPLRAVDAAAGEQAGELGDADAEDLLGEDVVDALLAGRGSRPSRPVDQTRR